MRMKITQLELIDSKHALVTGVYMNMGGFSARFLIPLEVCEFWKFALGDTVELSLCKPEPKL